MDDEQCVRGVVKDLEGGEGGCVGCVVDLFRDGEIQVGYLERRGTQSVLGRPLAEAMLLLLLLFQTSLTLSQLVSPASVADAEPSLRIWNLS